ncbi:class F sortase [Herbidospora cretacea]|uniref:class F sortase n=1 Tax=Herbidospora cretacea TaxID=28444 RepID=UPI0004C3AA0B|nr:class F sortase [Herbidospora cretacea]
MAVSTRMVVAAIVSGFVLFAMTKPETAQVEGERSTAVPERVDIPALQMKAPLIKLGLTGDGEVELPPYEKPKIAGWYEGSSVPGDKGAAVIIGHVDTKTAPAVFYRLRELKKGAVVKVVRSDGKTVSYKVDAIEQIPKESFPAEKVYLGEGLRLITCGGQFDWDAHEYKDNVIVYASRS